MDLDLAIRSDGCENQVIDLLFQYFSPRVIVDAYPSHFIFSRPARDFQVSVDTFIYLAKEQDRWLPIAISEEIPVEELRKDGRSIARVNVFDLDQPVPSGSDREELIEILAEFGIGMCFVKAIVPPLRPVVHFLGADRFRDKFENPRKIFGTALKHGGASVVVFDQMDL
jgi:hypothetical protein